VIHAATLGLYIAAFVLWLRALVAGRPDRATAAAGWVAATGVAAHFLALLSFTREWGQLPLIGLAPSFSTLSFLTGVALLFTLTLGEASRVGILVVPLMIILEATALALGMHPAPADLDFQGAWFALHVTLALASVGAMAIAAAAGALFLFQFRELKSRRLGRVFHFLPPLATVDRIGRLAVVSGFGGLTLALGLGWAWTYSFRRSLQVGDPKTVWAVFIWIVITGALVTHRSEGERRGAVGSVVAFGLIVLSYLVVRLAEGGGLFL
jgi:ABC-type uncharacterized transport system permease subunit